MIRVIKHSWNLWDETFCFYFMIFRPFDEIAQFSGVLNLIVFITFPDCLINLEILIKIHD